VTVAGKKKNGASDVLCRAGRFSCVTPKWNHYPATLRLRNKPYNRLHRNNWCNNRSGLASPALIRNPVRRFTVAL